LEPNKDPLFARRLIFEYPFPIYLDPLVRRAAFLFPPLFRPPSPFYTLPGNLPPPLFWADHWLFPFYENV